GVHSGAGGTTAGPAGFPARAEGAGPAPAAGGEGTGAAARVHSSATADSGLSKDLFTSTRTPVERGPVREHAIGMSAT
ncbi:hypothetical protein ACISU4_31205, partial [Streptomyces wuyuanensis]